MRLTPGSEATVVRGLRWQTRRLADAQDEARDCRLERRSVLSQKAVVAFHPAFSRLENAESLILVDGARHNRWLLAHNPLSDHFCVDAIPDSVVNQPATREQLGGHCSHVFDPNEVSKDVVALRRLRMIAQIDWPHGDTNPVRFTIEEGSGGHVSNLVAEPDCAPRLRGKGRRKKV